MNESDIYKKALKLFCGDYIYNQINNHGLDFLELKGEVVSLTVSIMHLFPFNNFVGNNDPKSVINFLYKFYDIVLPPIHSTDGVVINLSGDQIISAWGLLNNDSHYELSCKSALECLDRFNNFKDIIKSSNINLHIGISTGKMIVGNFGTNDRMVLNIMGDQVQLADNLMNLNINYKTNVLISEFTNNLLSKTFISREIDKIRFPKSNNLLSIYELL